MAGVVGDGSDITRELEDVGEQQRAISGVLRVVARSAGLDPVLEEVAEACRRLCNADHGALWLLDEGLLHVAAHHGDPEGAKYDLEHPHPIDRTTAAGRAALERKPVQIPDVLADPDYTYPGPRFFRTMLGVPIMVEDDLIGVVVVVRREPKPFTDDHIALVQTFADQAARRSRAPAHGAFSLRLAAGRSSDLEHRRPKALGRAPGVHHVALLRPPRLHRLR
jgi:two-component system NtrC family sensor kinase